MTNHAISLNAARLKFTDGASCKRWIASLPLTNLQAAQQTLAEQLALIGNSDIAAGERLRILEALREPVRYVQSELAFKYTAKALPLESGEAAQWTRTLGLWQELADAYIACRDALVRGDAALRNHGALIVMRSLDYSARAMFEHYRIYREVPADRWKCLHQLYVFAEQSGFAQTPVADVFNRREAESSCCAAYAQALLAELANPFALTGRQMDFVARWIENWAPQVSLSRQRLAPSAIPALCIDLAGSAGPAFADECEPVATLRYIDLEQIGITLRQTITLLKQGRIPASLNLGNDARQPGCENLLMLLYVQWCRAGTGRGEQRSSVAERAQVCLGMHAAHFFIGERRFRAPGAKLTQMEEHDVALSGRVSERTDRALASAQSMAVESWELVNQSSAGFMCMLRDHTAQLRIGHNQVVAVRRGPQKSFHVGLVQWLRIEENSGMYVGVRLFPGVARALQVRPTNFHAPSGVDGFERALLLPETTLPATQATLILPTGWYQAGRFVDLHDEQQQRRQVAKLLTVIERGSDFDRCTVVVI